MRHTLGSIGLFLWGALSVFTAPAYAAVADPVFVLNSRDATVSLLDRSTKAVIRTIDVGKEPHHLMVMPDQKSLIVANAQGNDLMLFDTRTGQFQRRVADIVDPYQIGFSPDQKWFVANALRLDHVDIYRYGAGKFALTKRLPLPKTPSHMAFLPDSSLVLVSLQGSDELVAIRLADQTVQWKMRVGSQPAGVWISPDGNHVLVGMTGSDYVDVIDWRQRKSIKRIKTGKGAHNFRPLGDGRHVFVSNRVSNTVTLIDQQSLSIVDQISIKGGPDCMEISADRKELWVTSRWAKSISVVDIASRKVTHTIPVGRSPHGIYFFQSAAWR